MSIEKLNLRQLKELEDNIPILGNLVSRVLANTYEEFIKVLYKDIDNIISILEENPELRKDDSEDRLTIEIISNLRCQGYDASHEQKHGGHTDILVKKNNYIWIGEAKIHSSYDYLWQGFQQLTTRYSTGNDNQKDGGLLIYIKNKNAKSIMDKWKDFLKDKSLPEYKCIPCSQKQLAFFSEHIHEKSGLPFRVRHIPVLLYFNPKDQK
jgi:hypothetical protein